MFYNSLGFIHYELVNHQHYKLEEIYLLFIVSTVLMVIPIIIFNKRTTYIIPKQLNINPSTRLIVILLTISVGLSYSKIILAGGWNNYINASYGLKVESNLMTFYHLFEGILSGVTAFSFPFLFRNNSIKIRGYIAVCLLFSLLIKIASGASASVINFLLPLFVFAYFQTSNIKKKALIKKGLLVGAFVGVILGMLIRINRADNTSFRIPDMSEMVDEIMLSRTFDNIVNLEDILTKLQPSYTINQFIYPFVHMLPRSAFPWKPVELGSIVGLKFVGTTEEARVGFLTSPIGDFYYDMGYVGIVFGMLFIGCCIVFAHNLMNRYMAGGNLYALVILVVFSPAFVVLNQWYTGCYTGLVKRFIFIFLLVYLQKIFGKNKKTYQINET